MSELHRSAFVLHFSQPRSPLDEDTAGPPSYAVITGFLPWTFVTLTVHVVVHSLTLSRSLALPKTSFSSLLSPLGCWTRSDGKFHLHTAPLQLILGSSWTFGSTSLSALEVFCPSLREKLAQIISLTTGANVSLCLIILPPYKPWEHRKEVFCGED